MDGVSLLKWLEACIPPIAFLLILWSMLEPKCSRRTASIAAVGFLAAEAVVQGLVSVLGQSPELAFTLFPLTLYLSAIVLLHLLSKERPLPTALIWLLALLCDFLLLALQKLLGRLFAARAGSAWAWAPFGVLLAAVLLLALALRFLRRPFRDCAKELEDGWLSLLFLPVMLLALCSYFLASVTNTTVLLLLFLTALAAILVLARLMVSLAEERRARQSRRQMEALRRDRDLLQKKLELGRSYRHDMRHHMTALSALLQQGDCGGAARYVADWQGQLTQIETDAWCRNTAVNGILSAYLAQARDAGCALDVDVSLPGEFPFEEIDLCIVLANALENAVNACEAAPEGAPRQIKLSMALTDQRRLTICVENSCSAPVTFDSNGFPIGLRQEGHGQGLHSIAAVAEKYHGLFQCDHHDGMFILRVVLLDGAPKPVKIRRAPAVCAGAFLSLFLLNCMPAMADALEAVPVLGSIVRVADLRSYALRWGDTGMTVQDPVLDGDGPVVDDLTARKDAFLERMREKFLAYADRKYRGYVAEDITYDVVRDDEKLFILRFRATLNAGGSADYSRCITLDKRTGRVLELSDLFLPDSNYLFPISREIQAQMAEQNDAGEGSYFLPGGIWAEEECFHSIEPDQNFYINESGQLVIVFAEYEVAAGSMGEPEFVIPTDVLDGLLAQPTILS